MNQLKDEMQLVALELQQNNSIIERYGVDGACAAFCQCSLPTMNFCFIEPVLQRGTARRMSLLFEYVGGNTEKA